MREVRIASLLSLLRQGIALEVGYGTHSIEALLWVAESIEQGIYARGSLHRTAAGVGFRLDNPPLRIGAFDGLRVTVGGRTVEPTAVRLRPGEGGGWRDASSISRAAPLELLPGRPTELELDVAPPPGPIAVRLELVNVAIPPRVWIEFEDEPTGSG